MKKKKIFTNNRIGRTGNNQSIYEVDEVEVEKKDNIISNQSVEEKINKLVNTNGYIFNIKVKIVTHDKTYNTKIANIVGNNLITLDNDVIRIDDIKDIIF